MLNWLKRNGLIIIYAHLGLQAVLGIIGYGLLGDDLSEEERRFYLSYFLRANAFLIFTLIGVIQFFRGNVLFKKWAMIVLAVSLLILLENFVYTVGSLGIEEHARKAASILRDSIVTIFELLLLRFLSNFQRKVQ
ncbi:hypothetical protein [Leptospira neocaledonica]|uniref:Uncharacterized protein n=1 Tax=Leptospira neocaledonica TaxID=2023192 RepID=A0A2M9ZXJ0_9LEPT|nr:hypothetical protein [Leptospira neocaledonica]PJZ76739.1 hypothetical protein CH365_12005 [Leptospira neocaledonica]